MFYLFLLFLFTGLVHVECNKTISAKKLTEVPNWWLPLPQDRINMNHQFGLNCFLKVRSPEPVKMMTFATSELVNEMNKKTRDVIYAETWPTYNDSVFGLIQFRQVSDRVETEVKGIVRGLSPNKKYFLIIHESKQKVNKKCTNLKGHLNPYNNEHGNPADFENIQTIELFHHLGDLGYISSNNKGDAVVNLPSLHISLFKDTSNVLSHAIAVHQIIDVKSNLTRIIACSNFEHIKKFTIPKPIKSA